MRWLAVVLVGATSVAAVVVTAAATRDHDSPAVVVVLGDVDDCRGDPVGTGCGQSIDHLREVRVGLDGVLAEIHGAPLALAPSSGGRRWEVDATPTRLRVFRPTPQGAPRPWMDLRLQHFGRAEFARLDWSADGQRFSY